jgi:hypothetical protein
MMMTADQASAAPEDGAAGSARVPMSDRLLPARRMTTARTARLAVAAVGALALVAALVTLVLGVLGIVPLLLPLLCLAVTAASVATLRLLVVRARRARVREAFAHAMSPVHHVQLSEPPTASAPPRPTSLFDAEATEARPLTPMQLRTAALAGARGPVSQDEIDPPTELVPVISAMPAGATAWAPVELPRPTYVDAAKAERQAPAPLDLPEAPRPSTKTPIKAAEAAARAVPPGDEADRITRSASPATGRINLDDVLQRRRA